MAEFGPPEVLRLVETPAPEPGPEDVLVRVAGAAVNWIDVSLRAGRLADAGLLVPAPHHGLGWDVAGTVASVGAAVTDLAPGDRVIGLRDVLGLPGSHAEAVLLHRSAVTPAPTDVDLVAAAALPLAGVTALGALADAGLGTGDRLLVTGAGGVIGRICVAVAAHRGVHVVAHGRPADAAVVTGLGAVAVVDDTGSLAAAVRRHAPAGVDAVVDTANLGGRAHEALRGGGGGRFVALVRPFAPLPLRGTSVVVHEAWADPARLRGLVDLVESGVVTVPEVHRHSLERASGAHAALEAGGLRGRVVLTP